MPPTSTRVLVADKFEQAGLDGLAAIPTSVIFRPDAGATNLAAAIAEHDPEILIVRSSKTPQAAIDAGKSLKCIIRAGAGFDNIEIPRRKSSQRRRLQLPRHERRRRR